jgi:hypothetical protein
MIDLDNIQANTDVNVKLPRLVEVRDYHEFRTLQDFLRFDLGLDVFVTEVGFNGDYIGLVHLDTPSHNQLVMELTAYYEEEENV